MEIQKFQEALLRFVNLCGTKTAAARKLSISRSTLDRWLNGYVPDLERFLISCARIHYNPDCLRQSNQCPFPQALLNALTSEDWQKLWPIAEALANSMRR